MPSGRSSVQSLKRSQEPSEEISVEIRETVTRILADVEKEGTVAVRRYSEQFDGWSPPSFRVSPETIERAYADMEIEVEKQAQFLIDQVTNFATLQRATLVDFAAANLPGGILGQEHIPVSSVGAYSPGGH